MTDDDTQDGAIHDLDQARTELAAVLEGAEPDDANKAAEAPDGLAKVGGGGLSIELRLNGATIPLEGDDVSHVDRADFRAFLDRQRLAIESGALDDAITRALATPGPGKALVRVRALETDA